MAGHGEGAIVASLLATGEQGTGIHGIVSLSGPALPVLGQSVDSGATSAPCVADAISDWVRTL